MSWSGPAELKAQLARLWERGELARCVVGGEPLFPLRLVLKGPTSSELAERFEAVRSWADELAALPRVRLEWRAVRHRVVGLQRLPCAAWVDSLDDALALLGRRREAERLAEVLRQTETALPVLRGWLARWPLQAIELSERWPRLLAVVQWLAAHPRPGIYLRQVDLPGVDSKFIEAHRRVLAELLDLALPAEAVRAEFSGVGQFAARYGFRDKPVRVRFRLLDPSMAWLGAGLALADVTLDVASFARLLPLPLAGEGGVLPLPPAGEGRGEGGGAPRLRRIFITENETNFLAFPSCPDSMVIFGAGYGWDALAKAKWLQACAIHYWGDIDTHGFAILDQLRARFAHVESLLMDRATLLAHETFWDEEPTPLAHDLPRLTPPERALYDDLRDHRVRPRLRLEQERVRFGWLQAALEQLDFSRLPIKG